MTDTTIDGVKIISLREISDARGVIRHGFNVNNPELADNLTVGEVYFSTVMPEIVKAWHLHKKMTLRYIAVAGIVILGLYDDRPNSPTQGKSMRIKLGAMAENHKMVVIPPGVWNGFRAVEYMPRSATVCNIASMPHDPDEIVRKPPADIPFEWGYYNEDISG